MHESKRLPPIETSGSRQPMPPAPMLMKSELVDLARQAAADPVLRGQLEFEVLAIDTPEQAEAAAARLEALLEHEREARGGTNRIEGLTFDGTDMFARRELERPVIVTGPNSGVVDTFWRIVHELEGTPKAQ